MSGERLLRAGDVLARLGISRTSLWRLTKKIERTAGSYATNSACGADRGFGHTVGEWLGRPAVLGPSIYILGEGSGGLMMLFL